MHFASDNWTGAHPAILDALSQANDAIEPAYGSDTFTSAAIEKIRSVFECDAEVFFVATGGAANGLALSCLTPPWGTILCHQDSHIEMDECAGPEFFTGGARLMPLAGEHGKLTPNIIETALNSYPERVPHGSPAHAISLTHLSESGTAYTLREIKALCDSAKARNLRIHMDGARFANALIHTGATPAEMSWKAGIDVLCLGATKNGAMAAEAVLFFDKALAKEFAHRRKRAGHLLSKQRFISAQFLAWLDQDRWLEWARHANQMASQLSQALCTLDGVSLAWPAQGNEVFAIMPPALAERLRGGGAQFYPWITPGDVSSGNTWRLICSWKTSPDDIDALIKLAR